MRRLPLVASFLLFIVLCAAVAYWALQLFKPPLRPVAAPPRATEQEVRPEAAMALFGGRGNVAVASNYQLKGVVFSGNPRDSIAILGVDGKPAQAIRVDMEVVPGVTVKEVHRDYVLLQEGGATKRVELPESAKGQINIATAAPVTTQPAPTQSAPPAVPSPTPPVTPRAQAAAQAQATAIPPPPSMPATMPPPITAGTQPPPTMQAPMPATPSQPIPGQPGVAPPPTVVVNPQAFPQPSVPVPVAPVPGQPATVIPPPVQPSTQPVVPGTIPNR